MTYAEQLDAWVAGNPIHKQDTNECCPDFSCCRPELGIPIEQRILFRDHPEHRHEMLMVFLGAAISSMTDKKVYLAGEKPGQTH